MKTFVIAIVVLVDVVLLVNVVYSFSVESGIDISSAVHDVNEEERRNGRTGGPTSLPYGSVCDGNKDDCQCYGKKHKCSCPWFGSGKCTCEEGYKHTCITKLKCPNKDEWGLDWRNEEERSPC